LIRHAPNLRFFSAVAGLVPRQPGWPDAASPQTDAQASDLPRLTLRLEGHVAMRGLQRVLVALGASMMLPGPGQAADIDYAVTVKGLCRFQTFFGWTACQDNVVYTLFKNDRYLFHFVDKDGNVYDFSGKKNRQVDSSNLYSSIDKIETTIKESKMVDSNATGGCNTTITPSGDSFISIDCNVSNSKKALFQFRLHDITHVERSLSQ
jgi:hypothetical protein